MSENKQKILVDISTKSIIKIFALMLILVFLYLIKDVLAIFLISAIIAAAMSPLISKLSKIKIPRSVSVVFVYVIFFGLISFLAFLIVPQVAFQIKEIAKDIPNFMNKLSELFGRIPNYEQIVHGAQNSLKDFADNLAESPFTLLPTISKIFGEIIGLIAIIVLVFYMSVAENSIKAFFKSVTPLKYEKKIETIVHKIQKKISDWVRGEALLMFVVGFLTFIGLKFLGIKYALTLAVIAGLLEIVPMIGPTVSAIPAVIVGFSQAPILGLMAIILYVIVQQTENHILVPTVMGKTTGISPVVVILSLLVGGKILGILGIILAVPVAVILSVFVDELIIDSIEKEKVSSK